MSIKIAQKYFHLKNERFSHLFKNCAKTWAKKFAAGFNAWPILVTLLKIQLLLFLFLKANVSQARSRL